MRAVLWHRSGAGAGAFQAPLPRGQRLSGTRGQRRERPSGPGLGDWVLDTGAGVCLCSLRCVSCQTTDCFF